MSKEDWIVDQLVRHGQPVDDATVKMSELLLTAQFGEGQEPWRPEVWNRIKSRSR